MKSDRDSNYHDESKTDNIIYLDDKLRERYQNNNGSTQSSYNNGNNQNNIINFEERVQEKYSNRNQRISLKEFLNEENREELTRKLIMLDKSIMELHENGYFVVSDMSDIDIFDNQVTLASFKNKVDYKNSGYNVNGDKQDILEIGAIGICAYNRFERFFTHKDFINYLIDNLEMFLENGNVPGIMQEYYIDVFARGHVDYLNNFLLTHEDKSNGNGKNNSMVYSKSTAVGRAFSEREKEAAYTNILLIPAILVLVGLIVFFVYFIFFR